MNRGSRSPGRRPPAPSTAPRKGKPTAARVYMARPPCVGRWTAPQRGSGLLCLHAKERNPGARAAGGRWAPRHQAWGDGADSEGGRGRHGRWTGPPRKAGCDRHLNGMAGGAARTPGMQRQLPVDGRSSFTTPSSASGWRVAVSRETQAQRGPAARQLHRASSRTGLGVRARARGHHPRPSSRQPPGTTGPEGARLSRPSGPSCSPWRHARAAGGWPLSSGLGHGLAGSVEPLDRGRDVSRETVGADGGCGTTASSEDWLPIPAPRKRMAIGRNAGPPVSARRSRCLLRL